MTRDSLWLDQARGLERERPPPEGALEVDVAIVGGGITGLSTAWQLKSRSPELDVVVLERERVGHGGSGRSTGALTPLPERRWAAKLARDGEEETRRAGAFQAAGVEAAVRAVEASGVDCGLSAPGYLMLGEQRHVEGLTREVEAMRRMGVDGSLVERDELRTRVAQDYWAAAVDSPARWLQPAKYVHALASLAEARGARVFEHAPVVAVERDRTSLLRLANGVAVKAGTVVLATNAYTPRLGYLRHRVYALHTAAIATEPLPAAEREALGWRGREILFESPRSGHTIMLTSDERLLCRGTVRYRLGDGLKPPAPSTYEPRLVRALRERFPQLGDLAVAHRWSGVMGMTASFRPAIGSLAGEGRLLYAAGYSGHGIAYGSLAGRLLAELYDGERSPELGYALEHSLPRRLPPDPLRWLGVNAATRWMRVRKK